MLGSAGSQGLFAAGPQSAYVLSQRPFCTLSLCATAPMKIAPTPPKQPALPTTCQGAQHFLARATGMRMTARLALLLDADATRALLLELAPSWLPSGEGDAAQPARAGPRSWGSADGTALASACPGAGLVASELVLEHTLLGSALQRQQAR